MSKNKNFLLLLLCFFIVVGIGSLYYDDFLILSIILVIIIFIMLSTRKTHSYKKLDRLVQKFYRELEPQVFINSLMQMDAKHLRYPELALAREVNLATGYFAAGCVDKAIATLEKAKPVKYDSNYALVMYVLYFGLCRMYIFKGDISMSKMYLQKLEEAKNNLLSVTVGSKKEVLKWCDKHLQECQMLLEVAGNNYVEPLVYFTEACKQASTRYQQVETHYIIAGIYEANGDINKQKEHLRIVASTGGKLYVAELARLELKKYRNTGTGEYSENEQSNNTI